MAALQHGLNTEKNIPLASITAVQFRKPSMLGVGYIQFVFAGSVESQGRVGYTSRDENTVTFQAGYTRSKTRGCTAILHLVDSGV